jgi:putative membrane-bound dehydrogenase-like protein
MTEVEPPMRSHFLFGLLVSMLAAPGLGAEKAPGPNVAEGWKVELVAEAPTIVFPTAIVAAPDGSIYLGQDPMDMPGPPTLPADSVVRIDKDGHVRVFAEKLWAVMGLEWVDGTLIVVHAPYLSAFRDTDGDGQADERIDLMTGLGPKVPGFSGINDHVASGLRLGMDGFLYIAVGDKGIPKGVGKDGTTIQLFGGGVIRIRPDGTGLEVVSTGERNPLSVMLNAQDDIFTYGNDDDSKKWPNSLTHHIVGGHYGYPYQFLTAPDRALPIMAGELGGSGAQGICYEETGLPARYRGNLFVCDWGLQTVFRYVIEPKGGTYQVKQREPFVTKGRLDDFRPFSLAVSADGAHLWLVDWAFNGWLAEGPKTGRLYRLTPDQATLSPRPTSTDPAVRLAALDHPARAARLESQRMLARLGDRSVGPLVARLKKESPGPGRLHALWALDAINTPEARRAIREALADTSPSVCLQAARSAGIRRDRAALTSLTPLLRHADAAVRREAAIALGKLGVPAAAPALYAKLDDPDPYPGWANRWAIRTLNAWEEPALTAALLDPRRQVQALKLVDEAWAVPVVNALVKMLGQTNAPEVRLVIVRTLAGLYRQYPDWSGNWFGTNPLAGRPPRKTRDWDPAGMASAFDGLRAALGDSDAKVRREAIAGLVTEVGAKGVPLLRGQLPKEMDATNLTLLALALGTLKDAASTPMLTTLAQDGQRPESVRQAALDALGMIGGPAALRARFSLVYDPKAPAALVAHALPALGRERVLPPNDLAGFFENPDPGIRAAALRALASRREGDVPPEVRQAVLSRLHDPALPVRSAAMEAAVALGLREAVPLLISAALDESTRIEATEALAALPDARALPTYLAALRDRNPELRARAESALLAIRDQVAGDLAREANTGRLDGSAALAIERILTRFRPIVDWRVIGPFPRTTAQVFFGEPSIDFARTHAGAEGRKIAWTTRRGDSATGRVLLDDFKGGAGDRGGFGYDTNGSPDLNAFGFVEIVSDSDRPALLLVGSSGTILVTLNEKAVLQYHNFAGRAYAPDSHLVRIDLKKGKNRLLLSTRQGIGVWSFSVQVSEPSDNRFAEKAKLKGATPEKLGTFALSHEGDPRGGEALFFDPKGIGCAKCHSAGGRGTASIGPDLTGLASKYDKAELVRSVLEPSNRIATGYQPTLLALHDGKVLTGVVRSETDAYIEIADAEARITRVLKAEIDERRTGEVSTMPAGLVDSLTPMEFTDLISYLQSLKAASKDAR